MLDYLKDLCQISGTSGNEDSVRDYIISKIDGFCEYKTDALGNILFTKKGKNKTENKIMIDAHTDEVGLIITGYVDDCFLRFETVGGIETSTLICRNVIINGNVKGVIGFKPIHLTKNDEKKKLPEVKDLYIDIGADSLICAKNAVPLGSYGVVCGDFLKTGDKILSKALDDRVGCATLIDLIRTFDEYDFCGSFSAQEEIGCRGAKTAAYTLNPDIALVLEGTTAADVSGVNEENTVCTLGGGVAISFMDGGTAYDRDLYLSAKESELSVQVKRGTTGGNDSAAIHLSRGGVKTLALSVPCRYIHSPSSVCDINDIKAQGELCRYLIKEYANKKL